MASPPDKPASRAAAPAGPRPDPRQERLARALRDNLKKRKAQQRRREAEMPSATPSAPPPAAAGGDDSPGGG